MKIKTFVVGYVLALAIFLFAQHRNPAEQDSRFVVVDLTHAADQGQLVPVNLSDQQVHRARHADSVRQLSTPEYYGTSVDAPANAGHGLWTVDQIPAERLVAPLVVLNVRSKVARNPDYQIGVEDIADWEGIHGHIPQGAVVVASTGWDSRWNSPVQYRNADSSKVMHFPGFSKDSARFLVEGRTAIGLGIDTSSIDNGSSRDYPVREYASAHSLYQLVNVANLAQAPEAGATIVIAPDKVQGVSRAPVRILAMTK